MYRYVLSILMIVLSGLARLLTEKLGIRLEIRDPGGAITRKMGIPAPRIVWLG